MSDMPNEDAILIRDRVTRLHNYIFGNGQPGLDTRLRKYIDERDTHKENNMKQMILDVKYELKEGLKPVKFIWVGIGIVLASQAFIGWFISVHH